MRKRIFGLVAMVGGAVQQRIDNASARRIPPEGFRLLSDEPHVKKITKKTRNSNFRQISIFGFLTFCINIGLMGWTRIHFRS